MKRIFFSLIMLVVIHSACNLPTGVQNQPQNTVVPQSNPPSQNGQPANPENPPDGQTLMPYKDAVAIYHFPLEVGGSWVSTGQVENGLFKGLQYAAKDTYEVRIDASGELRLPSLTFTQALRVRTKVTVQPAAGQSVTQQQVSFVFECFGEVARATSRPGETEEDFTVASEVRRLGIEP